MYQLVIVVAVSSSAHSFRQRAIGSTKDFKKGEFKLRQILAPVTPNARPPLFTQEQVDNITFYIDEFNFEFKNINQNFVENFIEYIKNLNNVLLHKSIKDFLKKILPEDLSEKILETLYLGEIQIYKIIT